MRLGLRSAGAACWLVERLRRRGIEPSERTVVGEFVQALQKKMGRAASGEVPTSATNWKLPRWQDGCGPSLCCPYPHLTGLSEAQLSSVIAHELAHIKRLDTLINLFQIGLETLLFYHPGVWWLNKKIREERENCCDDMAVEVCGNPLAYAHALARMAESRMPPRDCLWRRTAGH